MKPAKTIEEMIVLMRERGLIIPDESMLEKALYDNNYFRLSGYFRVFQKNPTHSDNNFIDGTAANDFLIIYNLDSQLRSLILQGTALLEVTLRSHIAYELSCDGHAYDYADEKFYRIDTSKISEEVKNRIVDSLVQKINKWIDMSCEVYIKHFKRMNEPIPIWAAIETLPFDTISKILSYHTDRRAISTTYKSVGLSAPLNVNAETIHSIVYLRNLCAHHSRLWKRETTISAPVVKRAQKKYPLLSSTVKKRSIAATLVPLMYTVDTINMSNEYSNKVLELLESDATFKDGILFPEHWA